ncbi:ABC transporter ATP-binding protein [Lentzea sp. JNUCC 0626]|uniref:ABC transporter ATP-binding protein n=1 Tax=Lentzea sp. JNUCC 0626 TaxID=3367513 RepID=UPI00374A0F2B
MEPRVLTEGLSKSYGDVDALVDVSVSVGAGRVLAVLGHNGAGKTTLVDVLSTRCVADSGVARVCGFDVARQGNQVRRRIGVATQFTALDDALSGRDNLILLARLLGDSRRQAQAAADEQLAAFGLTRAANRLVRTYSGGMRRRTDLAACMLGRPLVLFLDEPSTGLDPVACRRLWHKIKKLAEEGITIVLTTQYLEEAERLADDVIVLAGGRVVAAGTPRTLKEGVGRRLLTLTFLNPGQGAAATNWLHRSGLEAVRNHEGSTLTVPLRHAQQAVAAMRVVDAMRLVVTDVRVTEPTLEDVYLSLYRDPQRKR